MANTLRFKRGLAAGIPTGVAGEPLFTTDTFDLYIGNGTTNTRFQKYIASGTTSQLLRGDGSLLTMPIVLTSPANGEVLKYNGTNWVNSSDAGITGSGAAGQVAYFTGATTQGGSNNLFWDNTNGRLGIGTATPAASLTINSAATLATGIRFDNAGSVGYIFGDGVSMAIRSGATHGIQINTGSASLLQSNGSTGGFRIDLQTLTNAPIYSYFADADTGIGRAAVDTLTFYAGGEKARIFSTGNLAIGSPTDSGQRLQVTGDTLLKGSGNTISTIALSVQNSSSAVITTFRNDGSLNSGGGVYSNLGGTATNGFIGCNPSDGTIPSISATDIAIRFTDQRNPAIAGYSYYFSTIQYSNLSYTSGTGGFINVQRGFAPTSGTGVFNSLILQNVINQTGGANGITRGLYVNPILTAAADWRSIEWSNNTGWGLYGAGTANNYLAGALSIGVVGGSQGLRIGRAPSNADSTSNFVNVVIPSSVTTTYRAFASSIGLNASGFTLPNLSHFEAIQDGAFTAGVVTNQYGFRVNAFTSGTNIFAFHSNIGAATGRWNLYMSGTALNYLNGSLLIGSTTDNGLKLQVTGTGYFSDSVGIGTTAITNMNLRIDKQITGSVTSYGQYIGGVIQSDVTSAAVYYQSEAKTSASSFTLTNLYHYLAVQGTFGAGSTVTNQFGFRVFSNLTGATNNYGYYGDIASGTGRWNLYMNGTANNYMAGNLGIGITTAAGNLDVYNATSSSIYNRVGSAGANWITSSTLSQLGTYTNHPFVLKSNDQERVRIFANGNFGIGTGATDSGEKLQVTGTAKITGASSFGGNMTLSLNQNAATILNVSNTTNSTGSLVYIRATSSAGSSEIGKFSTTTTAYKIISANSGYLLNSTVGDLAILNDVSGGSIKFAANGSSTTQMVLTSSGNLSLIVPTYASSVRYGFGNPARTDDAAYIEYIGVGNFTGHIAFGTNASASNVAATEKMRLFADGNLVLNSTTNSGEKLQVTGTAKITGNTAIGGTAGAVGTMQVIKTGGTPVSNQLLFGTDGTGYQFAIGKNQAGTITNLVLLQDNGNFGINTAPSEKLHVAGNILISGATSYKVRNLAGNDVNVLRSVTGGTNTLSTSSVGNHIAVGTVSAHDLLLCSNDTERIRLSNEGWFSHINATNPTASVTDSYVQYSADVTAGNAAAHFRTENGAVIKLYQETTAVGNSTISIGGGSAVLDDTEFGGYTLRQVVKALQNQGILQ
jgi:hypothetical protein